MSVFNNARYLPLAVDSILSQTFTDFEFLIVDDGSTDGSSEIIDRYAAADSRVRAIHQPNRGLVASLNRLIEEARAPLIARMDGDDISIPERFERQIAFLDAHPDFGVVGTWTNSIDEGGIFRPDLDGHPTTHEAFLDALETGPVLCHPSVMMRRGVVREVGGYHAAFKHCEDYDLWLRLSERTKLCSLPERLILYRHTEGQVSNRHAVEQQVGAAIAWLAHGERMAGRPDASETWTALPPIEALDTLYDRPGIAREVRARVARGILYSPAALRGDGYHLLRRHIREGGETGGLWRTTARLITLGETRRAIGLAATLLAR